MKIVAALVLAALLAGCASEPRLSPTPTPRALSPDDFPTLAPPPIGLITFGQSYDEANQRAREVRTVFTANDPDIAWSVALAQAIGTQSLTLVIASRAPIGMEAVIVRAAVPVANPIAEVFAVRADLTKMLGNKPGMYVMRYFRDGYVLAEGTFRLVQ